MKHIKVPLAPQVSGDGMKYTYFCLQLCFSEKGKTTSPNPLHFENESTFWKWKHVDETHQSASCSESFRRWHERHWYIVFLHTWWPFPCMCVWRGQFWVFLMQIKSPSNRCPMGQKRGKERGNKKPKRFSKEFVVQIETTTTTVCFYCCYAHWNKIQILIQTLIL